MTVALIVNADDFGASPGVNAAIAECHAAGGLDGATLMAGGDAFEDAVSRVPGLTGLDIGVHVTLTGLRALSRPEEAPGLVDEAGFLPASPGRLLRGVLSGSIPRTSLFREMDLQILRVLRHGIVPTHLDTHKHVHTIPAVAEALAKVARKHYIRWIRDPFETDGTLGLFPLVERENRTAFLHQWVKGRLVRAWKPAFLRAMRREGLKTPDRFLGVSLTGLWNGALYAETLRRLRPGLTEIMFHPGYVDRGLEQSRTRLLQSREIERKLLVSSEFLELQTRLGIRRGRLADSTTGRSGTLSGYE